MKFILFIQLVGISVLLAATGCSNVHYYNEDRSVEVNKSFFELLKWQFTGDKKSWPDLISDNQKPNFTQPLKTGQGSVTFINHATEVIQFDGLTVITDPIFSERASPVSWIGPKRHRLPGALIKDLPPINVVVVSHNHYDHLDLDSLVEIENRDHPVFLVPVGNKSLLVKNGIKNVVELEWWKSYVGERGWAITLVPMQHWSARGVFDRFEALWGGYLIEYSGLKVLFAGDTGYNRQFKEIYEKFGSPDVSILPIGAYAPRWFMQQQHMDPKEAVQAHIDLQSKLSIGTHFGTFQLTDEAEDDPVIDLAKALEEAKIPSTRFIAPHNGQTIFFEAPTRR